MIQREKNESPTGNGITQSSFTLRNCDQYSTLMSIELGSLICCIESNIQDVHQQRWSSLNISYIMKTESGEVGKVIVLRRVHAQINVKYAKKYHKSIIVTIELYYIFRAKVIVTLLLFHWIQSKLVLIIFYFSWREIHLKIGFHLMNDFQTRKSPSQLENLSKHQIYIIESSPLMNIMCHTFRFYDWKFWADKLIQTLFYTIVV